MHQNVNLGDQARQQLKEKLKAEVAASHRAALTLKQKIRREEGKTNSRRGQGGSGGERGDGDGSGASEGADT